MIMIIIIMIIIIIILIILIIIIMIIIIKTTMITIIIVILILIKNDYNNNRITCVSLDLFVFCYVFIACLNAIYMLLRESEQQVLFLEIMSTISQNCMVLFIIAETAGGQMRAAV